MVSEANQSDDCTVLDVRPGSGIGPIEIGMTRDEVITAAKNWELAAVDFRRTGAEDRPDLLLGGQLFAYFQDGDRVAEIEVAVSGPRPVVCLGIDLAGSRVELLAQVAALDRMDENDPEYPSVAAFPEIGVSFWTDSGIEGEGRIDAALVRTPDPSSFDQGPA